MNISHSVTDLIGHTPLVQLTRFCSSLHLKANIYAKLESFNPSGSAKDRAALSMILHAEKDGLLSSGGTIIEPTSGNTGIGLAAVGISRGYKVILTMPESMSEERRKLLKAYGAQLVLSPAKDGMAGAIALAEEIKRNTPNSIIASQFDNPNNPLAHYETTGPEIWNDMDGLIDCFVAGIGTGGTVSGVGKFLKEQNPSIEVIGVEPAASPLITQGQSGPHGLQGIGANFVPGNYDARYVDRVLTVTEADAYQCARDLLHLEGFFCGITSGASLAAACMLANMPGNDDKNIVALLPDSGDRYLSTKLYSEE